MKIRTPQTSISSCNSDRQSIFDRALTRMQNLGVGSVVGGLAGAIGLRAGLVGILAIGGSFSVQQTASAQSLITNVTATPTAATNQSFTTTTSLPCDANVGTCGKPATTSFGTGLPNDLNINSVTTSSGTYTFRKLSSKVVINRLNNPNVTGDRQIIYFQGNSPVTKAAPPVVGDFKMFPGAVSTMETALLNQAINRGSDNIFANAISGTSNAKNYNNVERVDYIITDGITPTTNAELDDIGFVVMDRGSNDSYKIAPILTLASGSASTFGTPVISAISTPTTINGASSTFFYVVTRLESGEAVIPANLHPVDTTLQSIGGYFVSLRSLGITTIGQTIYGYSLLSPTDGPITAAQMNSTSISGYPNTTDLGGGGGFDMVAGGGIFSRNPLPVVKYTVSGNVFNDVSGNKLQDGAEPLVNGSTLALNAVLFDVTGNTVYGVTSVSATGTYTFGNVVPGNYTVILTTSTALVGGIMPTIALPTNWTTTGENLSGTVETTPATPDSKIAITVAAANITNLNFGIEQLPTAIAVPVPTQANPGGNATVNIPPGSFNTSTDPDGGTVTSYKITAFPSNVTSITIGTTTYTATTFPVTGGVTVLATALNTINIDPIDGGVTVQILFKAIDNAGQESANTATIDVPFTAPVILPSITGNVFDDGNGTKLKDGTTEDYTAADITAVLLDSNSKVIGTAAIDSFGNYSLDNVPAGTYTVKIIKTPTTALVINAVIPAADDVLPTNLVATGENNSGTIDGVVDRTLSVTVATTNVTGINFGIEKLPTAIAVAVGTQLNPGGTATVNIPSGSFTTSTDPDGTVTSYKITAFPSNVTSITIGTTTYTATTFPVTGGVTVLATALNTINIDPIDGGVTVQILFKAIDNAGQESANTATVNAPFNTVVVDPPQLILLKRITKINSTTIAKASNGSTIYLTAVVPQPDNPATLRDESKDSTIDSSNALTLTPWPAANYPQGSIDAGVIKTGDLIEYTIYFLSIGGKPVTNANLCDWVPTNTVFEPNSYGVGKGIQLAIGSFINTLTNVPDGDRAVFFNPGAILPATYPSGATSLLTCRTPAGSDGAVVVNLVKSTLPAPDDQLPNATAAGTPGNSYGFIRFVSKVK